MLELPLLEKRKTVRQEHQKTLSLSYTHYQSEVWTQLLLYVCILDSWYSLIWNGFQIDCLLKSSFMTIPAFLMCFRPSVVLCRGRGGTESIALLVLLQLLYKSRLWQETLRLVNRINLMNFQCIPHCSRQNNQTLWWNWLSLNLSHERNNSSLCCRGLDD